MKIKVTFDPDGAYGYPLNEKIEAQTLIEDYIECLNPKEDANTISFLRRIDTEKAVDFVAEKWGLDYEYV